MMSLNWQPFVGKNYGYDRQKILFVGESYYLSGKGNPNIQKVDFPTLMVREKFINEEDQAKFHKSTNQLLGLENKTNLWENYAFTNIIPRPMNHSKDRPTDQDWRDGWSYVDRIVQQLNPDIIIFLGIDASKFVGAYCKREELKSDDIHCHDKIDGAMPRVTKFRNKQTLFVLHPSRINSFDLWRKFLVDNGLVIP